MDHKELVSVIIPTYKRADTLPRAINSVLNQTYKRVEIIVVDDNDPSTLYRKNTENIMKQYENNINVHYVKHEKNKNGSAARNTGIRKSIGEYIMFLDDDDEFLPEKIDAQVEFFEKRDETWGACYTNYIRKKNGKIIVRGSEKREGYLLKEELMRNLFVHAGSNLMIRRSVVEEVKGFDESFVRNQDIEFLSRILINYKLGYIDVTGLVVHAHDFVQSQKSFEEITEDYRIKFATIIEKLSDIDKVKVNNMLNLQLFRYYITTSNMRKKAIQQIKNKDIRLVLTTRYLIHLIVRKFSKKAYGFKI